MAGDYHSVFIHFRYKPTLCSVTPQSKIRRTRFSSHFHSIALIADAPPTIQGVAEFVENLRGETFDEMIPESLLRRLWARANRKYEDDISAVAQDLYSHTAAVRVSFAR